MTPGPGLKITRAHQCKGAVRVNIIIYTDYYPAPAEYGMPADTHVIRYFAEKLMEKDLNTLTPIEAMNFLFELKKMAETV